MNIFTNFIFTNFIFILQAGQSDFVIENANVAGCTTSEGQSGSCIVLPKCSYAMEIIAKSGIVSRQAQFFLRSNQCGFEDNDPKVCCPKQNGSPDERNPFEEKGNRTQDTSKEVGDNPNDPYQNPLSLLPDKCGEDYSNRIIGGEITELDEFPWMAVLEYQQGRLNSFSDSNRKLNF